MRCARRGAWLCPHSRASAAPPRGTRSSLCCPKGARCVAWLLAQAGAGGHGRLGAAAAAASFGAQGGGRRFRRRKGGVRASCGVGFVGREEACAACDCCFPRLLSLHWRPLNLNRLAHTRHSNTASAAHVLSRGRYTLMQIVPQSGRAAAVRRVHYAKGPTSRCSVDIAKEPAACIHSVHQDACSGRR